MERDRDRDVRLLQLVNNGDVLEPGENFAVVAFGDNIFDHRFCGLVEVDCLSDHEVHHDIGRRDKADEDHETTDK